MSSSHVVATLLARPRHLQVLEHLLQLLRAAACAASLAPERAQLLHAVDHVLEILRAQHARCWDPPGAALLRVLAHLLGERLQELVERGAQVGRQLLDLFVAWRHARAPGAALPAPAAARLRIGQLPSSIVTAIAHIRADHSRSWSSVLARVRLQKIERSPR